MNGEQLREARERMGWSQRYLADALGVTRAALAHWEWGRAPVPHAVGRAVGGALELVSRALKQLEKRHRHSSAV